MMLSLGRGLLVLVLAAAIAGCGGGGGGGSSGGGATPAGTTTSGSSASASQWQVALAALGPAYTPGPISLDAAGFDRWSALLAQGWPAFRTWIDPELEARLRAQLLATLSGGIKVTTIRSMTIDTAAPPAFRGLPGGTAVKLELPAAPAGWSLSFTIEVSATVQTRVLGIPTAVGATLDVTVDVVDVHGDGSVTFDLHDPVRPDPVATAVSPLDGRVVLSSQSPFLQQLSGPLTQLLGPIVRVALAGGSADAQRAIADFLARMPRAPYGVGGPAPAAVAPAPDLARIAEAIDVDAQRDHLPFGMLLAVHYSQPGYGNGVPVRYEGYGDSALWTGSYVAAEALRFEVTGDARAVDGARRALGGLRACLEVTGIPGLLCRTVVPTSSPHASAAGGFIGQSGGVSYGAIAGISRDQYIGTILGIMSAWRRVPALRAEAASLMAMICVYLEGTGWNAMDFPSGRLSAPFTQTPDVLWSVIQGANAVDRASFGALHDANQDLARIAWLPIWLSSRDLLQGYFPANLFHGTAATLVSVETDPALYREYVKGFEIMREATGHHGNAWFDATWGMAAPASAAATGALIETALQRFTLRDRRSLSPDTNSDPTVTKVFYTPPAAVSLNGQPPTGFWVAATPIPVEKRRGGDFIWQQSPFHLSGGQNEPDLQQPGVDFLLAYWAARAYGILR